MRLGERVRDLIEGLLPWYDPEHEARRDRRSSRIQRMSVAAHDTAEKAMPDDKLGSYRRVSAHRR